MPLTLNPTNFRKVEERLVAVEQAIEAAAGKAAGTVELDVNNLAARIKAAAVEAAIEAAKAVVAEAAKPAPAKAAPKAAADK